MTHPDDRVWEDIKHAYIAGDETIDEISYRTGVPTRLIHARRLAEGWPMRSRSAHKRRRGEGTARPSAAALELIKNRRMIERLFHTVEIKLEQLEVHLAKQLKAKKPLELTANERENRAIAVILRNLEKIKDFQSSLPLAAADPATAKSAAELAADAERWRREIAERIERLRKKGRA